MKTLPFVYGKTAEAKNFTGREKETERFVLTNFKVLPDSTIHSLFNVNSVHIGSTTNTLPTAFMEASGICC